MDLDVFDHQHTSFTPSWLLNHKKTASVRRTSLCAGWCLTVSNLYELRLIRISSLTWRLHGARRLGVICDTHIRHRSASATTQPLINYSWTLPRPLTPLFEFTSPERRENYATNDYNLSSFNGESLSFDRHLHASVAIDGDTGGLPSLSSLRYRSQWRTIKWDPKFHDWAYWEEPCGMSTLRSSCTRPKSWRYEKNIEVIVHLKHSLVMATLCLYVTISSSFDEACYRR